MKSTINELLIKWHFWRFLHAQSHDCKVRHMHAMYHRIRCRAVLQIERMEREKGLK